MKQKQYGMVIDLQKCVGCGACALACKTENNTPQRANGQTFNWADFLFRTEGKFPDIRYTTFPVLCNHCSDAFCVKECPVTPKAMFKSEDGITLHNAERCIGCQSCQDACPYSALDVDKETAAYSVISFNEDGVEPYQSFRDSTEIIKDGTASGAEVAKITGKVPPYRTVYNHPDYSDTRKMGIVEKCIFCDHRVKNGDLPYCVTACPAGARVFGDLNDPNSEARGLIKQHKAVQLKNNKDELLKDSEVGTKPNVYYIRSFHGK